jgi:L-ascorbate metabolism protein UlaG (beta-lactamase superfamily)
MRPFALATATVVAALALLVAPAVAGAAGAGDTIPATGGTITVTPIQHATLQLTFGAHVVLVDPTEAGQADAAHPPTLILVTDIHPDHLAPKTVAAVKSAKTAIVAPAAAATQLPGATPLANGETKTADGIRIEGVPMYNLVRGPKPGALFHDKGRGDGFVLTLGGKRVYIAGDTECTPEMKALKDIDIAFVPMNLPYTMTPAEAAACVKAFHPKIVYPYHYRGQDPAQFAAALKDTGIDVRLRDWYGVTAGH